MKPEGTPERYPVTLFSLVVEAWVHAAHQLRAAIAAATASARQARARSRERRQLAQMTEREWSDLGLTKCDVVNEVEKPSRRP